MSKKQRTLGLALFSLIILTDVLESLTQLFLKRGAMTTGFIHLFLNGYVWMGVLFYIVNFFLWMAVLSQLDLSVAFPVGSTSHILVPVAALVILHEKIPLLRWSGILLILSGIFLIQTSTQDKPNRSSP